MTCQSLTIVSLPSLLHTHRHTPLGLPQPGRGSTLPYPGTQLSSLSDTTPAQGSLLAGTQVLDRTWQVAGIITKHLNIVGTKVVQFLSTSL